MAAGISLPRSALSAAVLETLLYGMYTVLFGITVYLLIAKRQKTKVTLALLVATVFMWCIGTAHEGILIDYTFTNFLYHDAANNASDVLNQSGDRRIFASIVLEGVNCIIGDTIVIWRVWALWSHSKKAIAIPIIFWIASLGAGLGLMRQFAIVTPGEDGLLSQTGIVKWSVPYMISTFMTNFAAVVAIAYRHWLYRREVVAVLGRDGSESHSILLVIIESGVLYCFTWALALITYLAGSRGLYILIEGLAQLTGIYPTLIIVLVCLKMTQKDHMDKYTSETLRFNHDISGLSCDLRPTLSIQMQPLGSVSGTEDGREPSSNGCPDKFQQDTTAPNNLAFHGENRKGQDELC